MSVSAHLVPASSLETSLTGAILSDHSLGLGENQLRPSARSLVPALAAQRVTEGCQELTDWSDLAVIEALFLSEFSFLSVNIELNYVDYNLAFSDISFHWSFEILMVCDEWN